MMKSGGFRVFWIQLSHAVVHFMNQNKVMEPLHGALPLLVIAAFFDLSGRPAFENDTIETRCLIQLYEFRHAEV